ncbi:MAG TPA: FtsX-like permease family protein, partial [Microthrixaceae bacterium]|nr:FtsX-like permease family protein [Microthrixaceae bacterium]
MRPGTGMWRMVLALVRQRRRLWLATFAVALSVGYLAGALTLLNRVSEGLADLSSAGAENADMVIEGDVAYESALEQTRRLIPSSIGQSLIGQPGIAAVIPRVEDVVMLLKTDGSPVVAPGLSEQPLGANWPADSKMSPYRFVGNGRAPEGPNEVAIDHRSAESAGLSVGDDVAAVARTGLARFKIVGIVTTDRGDLPAGSSLALFSTDEARKLFGMADNDNRVAIRLEPGADRAAVENQIRAWLPAGSMVVDGETGALHRQESLTRSFTLIRVLIMGFAGLALVVGMVTVANSLTLLYSERRHSFATFRLVGAKRVQIMGAALTEAAMLAGAASLLGAPLGLLLGALIEIVLGALGTSVPVAGSFVSIPALLTAVAVGSVATVLAALVPAWKACGVPAIEAVVESESGREAPYSQRLANAAIVSVAVGFVTLGFLSIADILPGSTLRVSLLVGLGVLAVSQLPTLLAHAVALGIHVFPEKSGALRRIGARDAIRNRTRTAATTGALMLATAVVVGLAVFLSSFAGSLDADVKGLVSADLVIDSGTFTVGGLPTGLVDEVSKIDGVKAVSGWQVGRVFIGDLPIRLTGMDGDALSEVLTPDWIGKAPKPLSPMGIALSNSAAAELGVKLGSEVPVNFASQATEMMTVEGIYASGKVLLGEAVINRELLTRQVPKSTDIAALVSLKPDSEAARAKVTELAKSFGVKAVLDPSDFVNSRSTLLKGFERVIQWMLLFTLLQALVGVVNTLLLSVGERRR